MGPAAQVELQAAPGGLSLADIEAKLSAPVYEVIERSEALVEGSDGTKLWLDVYRPTDAEEKVPVILYMTPYRTFGASSTDCLEVRRETCPFDSGLVDFFAPRGYAVAFADLRGNHNSGGCNDHMGPQSRQDGYDIVEWLGTQSWSNGRVGMFGGSYDGHTQIGAAALNPPHLVTIVPIAAPVSNYHGFYYDGVPYWTAQPWLTTLYLEISARPGTHPNAVESYKDRFSCQPDHYMAGFDHSGDWSPYWAERDLRQFAPGIRASVLQVQGLQDHVVDPDNLDGFWNNLTSEKRLILGQWEHAYPDRPDWDLILHRWFDHYLKGIDTGILQDLPSVLVEDDAGDWRAIDAFPPAVNATLTFHPTADGSLPTDALGLEDSQLILHDYPRVGEGRWAQAASLGGETVTGHPRMLVFESEPLLEDFHYAGRPVVHLVASTDAKSTHWAVRLIELGDEPDPLDYVFDSEAGESQTTNRGFHDTRHRFGVDKPKDLTPGEVYELDIRLLPQDDIIEKGHRLVLVLNNNDNWIEQDTTFATSTVYLGPEGTRLLLPLAPAGPSVPEDALRPGLRPADG